MYVRKTTKVSEGIILVQEHGPGRYGAPGEKRKKRTKKTPEAVIEQNRKNRAEKIQLAILGNFMGNGHHIVLGYPKGEAPETFEEAEKNLTRFLEGIKRFCKGKGYEFRYIGATERGKRRAVLHHHLIIQDINEPDLNLLSLIENKWPGKRVHSTATYEDDTMGRQLADYIVKSIDKDCKGKYHISRNLAKPEVKRELIYGYMDDPVPPKGYQIVPDTFFTNINPWTGWPYQRYFLRSLEIKKNSCLPEWNSIFERNETPQTITGTAKRFLGKLKDVLFQNGNEGLRDVDNSKHSKNAGKGQSEKTQNPATQNGTAAFQTVEKTEENNGSIPERITEDREDVSQNGNAVTRIVDKIKPLWARIRAISKKDKT